GGRNRGQLVPMARRRRRIRRHERFWRFSTGERALSRIRHNPDCGGSSSTARDPAILGRKIAMARITLRQLLDHAAEREYGVPAFNINNMEQGLAIMEAAASVDAPV